MTTIRIDLTGKPVDTVLALAEFTQMHGLKMHREDSAPSVSTHKIRVGTGPSPAVAAALAPIVAKAKAKRAAKAPRATKAKASTVTTDDVLAAVKGNPGQRSEVYTGLFGDKEAVKRALIKLRKEKLIVSGGKGKRDTTWSPVTVEHKGQALVPVPRKVTRGAPVVRNAVTKVERPMNVGAEE